MKLKPVKKKPMKLECNTIKEEPVKKESNPKTGGKKANKLPPDGYAPMFPPKRFLVREKRSEKDPSQVIKQYIEISVKRFNDDEAMPFVWLQMYQESDLYTGYCKGKSVYLPLEMLYDLIDNLSEVSEECDRRHIE